MNRYDNPNYAALFHIKYEYQKMYDAIFYWNERLDDTNDFHITHYLYGMGWVLGDMGFHGWEGDAAKNECYHYDEVLWYHGILKETLRNLLGIPSRADFEISHDSFAKDSFIEDEKFANMKSRISGMVKDYQKMYDTIQSWDKPIDLPEDPDAHFGNLSWHLSMPTPLDASWLEEDFLVVKKAYKDLKNALQRAIGIHE